MMARCLSVCLSVTSRCFLERLNISSFITQPASHDSLGIGILVSEVYHYRSYNYERKLYDTAVCE